MADLDFDCSGMLIHSVIDDDHTEMIDHVNCLLELMAPETRDAMLDGDRWAAIRGAAECLRQAADEHFRVEEGIMERAGYPLLDSHRHRHRESVAELMRFAPVFCSPRRDVALKGIDFLRVWNSCHVKTWDARLVRWLHGRAAVQDGGAGTIGTVFFGDPQASLDVEF